MAAGLIVAALAVVGCGAGSPPTAVAELESEQLRLGGAPWGIAIDGGVVWVSDASRGELVALDERSGRVRSRMSTGATDPRDAGLSIVDGRVWVANLGGSVGLVDAARGVSLGRAVIGPGEPAAVAADPAGAWAPRHGPGGGLTRISAELEVTTAVPLGGTNGSFGVELAGDAVWVTGIDEDVFEVDAASGAVRSRVALAGSPRGVAVSDDDIWVALRDRREVARVDRRTGQVTARVELDGQPWPIAADGDSVWVATLEGRLLRIDQATNEVTAQAAIAPQGRGIAIGAGAVWVTSQLGVVTRVLTR